MRLLVCSMLLFCYFFIPGQSLAFNARTHLWVGQQVLNDVLPDGKVTILSKDYDVNPTIVEALRNNQRNYRMGHIGPDAHPDLVAGQCFIHPGVEGGWQTDDWAKWIQDCATDPKSVAYAKGFWGHIAGDIISHTYVNTYAGDYFSFLDKEVEVEQRHYTLEKYIGQLTPSIGNPDELVAVPASFLAKTLILNDDVCTQYRKSLFGGGHLMVMQAVKKQVSNIVDFHIKLTDVF